MKPTLFLLKALLSSQQLGVALIGSVGAFITIQPGLTLPEGGAVQAGQAQINQVNPSQMNIIQQSDRAVINWHSFSVGADQYVDFQQPSSTSATLNRVTGEQRSDIAGRITANGQVMLVNPNGILFRSSAQIDLAGLMATTLDIPDQDFMSGRLNLQAALGKPSATVENQGQITVGDRGFAAFVAPGVANNGVINARLGKVVLASGTAATLDFFGDGLVSLAVDPSLAGQVRGADGQPLSALVTQSGQINADGGLVMLSARAGGAIVNNVINMSGVTQARSVANQNGAIVLSGGDAGIVRVAGTLDASGTGTGQTGGTVNVLGDKVGLFDNAHINVSGDAGGGIALVGGDYKGQGTVSNASRTYVSSGSTINADAIATGNGGKVIVWADDTAHFNGNISARGSSNLGNGGFVEVSGKEDLVFRGTVNLSANNGIPGTLLLDPRDIRIVSGSGGTNDNQITDQQILAGDPGEVFTISQTALEALSGNVRLEATNNITIEDLPNNPTDQNDQGTLNLFQNQAGSIAFIADADGDRTGSFSMNPQDTIKTNNGGDLTIAGASITAGAINTRSDISRGGNVNLSSTAGNIQISYIDTSSDNQTSETGAIEETKGGDVTINAFGLFRATGFGPGSNTSAVDINGNDLDVSGVSILATGFTGNDSTGVTDFRGGRIAITHGGESFVTGVTNTNPASSDPNELGIVITVDPGFTFPENASGTVGAILSRNTNGIGRVIFPDIGGVSNVAGNQIPLPVSIPRGSNTSSIPEAQTAVETATRRGSSDRSCEPSDSDTAVVDVANLRRAPEESRQPSTTTANETSLDPCDTSNPQESQSQPNNPVL